MRLVLIFILALMLFGCGKTPEEKQSEAIDIALTMLSYEKCEAAIKVLEDAGRTNDNAKYLQVLASAYACKADYEEIKFIKEVASLKTSLATIFADLSIRRLSTETEADSDNYLAIREGLDILIASTTSGSHASRVTKFGRRDAGGMSIQLLLMGLTQLGKFLHYYGDVGTNGAKGGGSGSSTCFIEYSYGPANTYVNANGGVCNSVVAGDGHPDLSLAVADVATTQRRLCEGLTLITSTIDILENVDVSLDGLEDITSTVTSLKDTIIAVDPNLETLMETYSRAECEDLVSSDPNEMNNLQYIYAILFDGVLKAGVP